MIVLKRNLNRNIIFDGNSLTYLGQGNVEGVGRYPYTCYSSIISLGKKICMSNISAGSTRTTYLKDSFVSRIPIQARENDIVVFWEITNEAHDFTSDTDGVQLAANVQAYYEHVSSLGFIVVCLTGIARDQPSFDDANITDRIIACNNILRTTPSSYCDLLVDVGALSPFDAKADTTDTTYYHADRTHLTTTGYDLIATTVYNSIVTIL